MLVWKLDRFRRSAFDVLANIRELEGLGVRFVRPRPALGAAAPVILPETPPAESALLVNASGEASLGRKLTRGLASAGSPTESNPGSTESNLRPGGI